jgi:hypothetical protein
VFVPHDRIARRLDERIPKIASGDFPSRADWVNLKAREFNDRQPASAKAGFYGIDLYSLFSSIDAVLVALVDRLGDHRQALAGRADFNEEQVRHALEGNLCRCTGYHNIVKAVMAAAREGVGAETAKPPPPERPEAAEEVRKGVGA